MVEKVSDQRRRVGRPVTVGADYMIAAKFPAALVERIDEWAKTAGIGRSEAMRRLVEMALKPKRGAAK